MTENLKEGVRLFHEKRWDQALYFLEDLNPQEEPDAPYYMALIHSKLQNPQGALISIEKVLQFETNFLKILQARMIRAYLLTLLDRLAEAEKSLESLLSEGVESAQVYSHYGYVLWAQGRARLGIPWLNKALKLDPENTNAMNSLGFILAEEGIMLDRALALCKKAAVKDPKNPSYLDSLGWVFHKLGQEKMAEFYLVKALEAAPDQSKIREHLDVVRGRLASGEGRR